MKPKIKLGTREFVALIALMIGTKIGDLTPALLAKKASNAFWLIPMVSFIVMFPTLFLLLKLLKKYKDKNLLELTNHLLGKYIGKMVGVVLFLILFLALSLDSRNFVDEINIQYFPKSPLLPIYSIFLIICFWGAKKGLENIAVTGWLVFPYIKISLTFLAFLIMVKVVWLRIFPIFGTGLDVILTEGVKKASMFGELIVLTMAYNLVDKKENYHKASYIGLFLVLFELTGFYLLYCTLFDYKSIDKVAYHFHEASQYVDVGAFFTNIETFFLSFWLLAGMLRFIVYLYLATWIFGATFNIKNFEPLLLPILFLSISVGLFPENAVESALIYRDHFLNVVTYVSVGLPVLLWMVAKMKGEFKHEKET